MSKTQTKLPKKIKVIIIILCVLLVCSLGALVTRAILLRNKADHSTVVVPNNYLGKDTSTVETLNPSVNNDDDKNNDAASNGTSQQSGDVNAVPDGLYTQTESASLLEFYKGKANVNKKFEVRNMVPGDSITKYFCVRAHHDKAVDLVFQAEVTEQTRKLGDVLDVVVTDTVNNKVVCKGTFNEINGSKYVTALPANQDGKTVSFFKIDVSMDTSVGNDYQVARLLADLHWYIEEEDVLNPLPQTGDTTQIALWIAVGVSAIMILFLMLFVRRREEEEHE